MTELIEHDATNAIEKTKLGEITKNEINFNLISEILIHHHDELVEPKGFGKHFNKNINNPKLREFIHYVLTIFKKVYTEEPKIYTYLIQQMNDDKVFTQEVFDALLTNMRTLIEFYNNRINIVDVLIQNNSKAVKILNVLKTKIKKGIFLDVDEERFFQFCQLEHEKKKIYKTGIVPIGWLPSDVSDMSSLLEKVGITLDQQAEMTNRLRNYAIGNSMLHMSGSMKR